VAWSGSDQGAGAASSLEVNEDGGAWQSRLTGTQKTSYWLPANSLTLASSLWRAGDNRRTAVSHTYTGKERCLDTLPLLWYNLRASTENDLSGAHHSGIINPDVCPREVFHARRRVPELQ